MNNEKISSTQLSIIVFLIIMTTDLMQGTSNLANIAKESAWISNIVSICIGISVLLIVCKLGKRFPNSTLFQYSEIVFGKILGKILIISYCLFFLIENMFELRRFSEFMQLSSLAGTPRPVIYFIFLLASGYMVFKGLDIIARMSQILLPLFSLIFIGFFILLFSELDLGAILPIFDAGAIPIVKASLISSSWYGDIIIIALFIPFVNKPNEVKRKLIWILIICTLLKTFIIIITIATFGPNFTGILQFSFLYTLKKIEFGKMLPKMDFIFITSALIGIIFKIAVLYYLACKAVSQVVNKKSYKIIIIPVGLLFIGSSFLINNIYILNDINKNILPFIRLIFELVLPLLLLIFAAIRSRIRRLKENDAN